MSNVTLGHVNKTRTLTSGKLRSSPNRPDFASRSIGFGLVRVYGSWPLGPELDEYLARSATRFRLELWLDVRTLISLKHLGVAVSRRAGRMVDGMILSVRYLEAKRCSELKEARV